jgi:acetate kinase
LEIEMDDYALILNAGSSSLKFCVFQRPDGNDWQIASRGQIEGLGTAPRLRVKNANGEVFADHKLISGEISDGHNAIGVLAEWLRSNYRSARVLGVGHRVVHGGSRFTGPTILDRRILAELSALIPLAPLHQPYNLAAIEALFDRMPTVPQVACFDTSFHRGHTQLAKLIPLPSDLCRAGIERYGFHGISYEYIASVLPQVAPGIANGRIIIAHLGSGASLCALKNGKSVDSTLGFTALDGLCMGTRPGSIDPGVVLFLFQSLGLSARDVETILYKKSGLLAISGISNDMRDLLNRREPGARLAVDYFVYRTAKEIGALTAVLGGLDALVFTAGIGENSPEIRRRICESSAWLGIELDSETNANAGPRISTEDSKVSVWVIPTSEELMIARHTASLLGLRNAAHASLA